MLIMIAGHWQFEPESRPPPDSESQAPGPGGGLVTVSRGLVHADDGSGDPAVAAAEAAAGYRSQAWSVSGG